MFARRSATAAELTGQLLTSQAKAVSDNLVPFPTPIVPLQVHRDMDGYESLCEQADFPVPEKLRVMRTMEAVMRSCVELGLVKYDTAKVMEFLHKKAGERQQVVWVHTRKAPVGKRYMWTGLSQVAREYDGPLWDHYNKPIPISALTIMRELGNRHPSVLDFYVSDYAAIVPDPFLAFAMRDVPNLLSHDSFTIVHHWDEPDFVG